MGAKHFNNVNVVCSTSPFCHVELDMACILPNYTSKADKIAACQAMHREDSREELREVEKKGKKLHFLSTKHYSWMTVTSLLT